MCKGKQDRSVLSDVTQRSSQIGKDCDYVAEVGVMVKNNLNGIVGAGTTGEKQQQNEKSMHLFLALCCTLE